MKSLRVYASQKLITPKIFHSPPTVESPCAKLADIPVVLAECVEDVDYKVTGVVGLLYGLWIVLIGIALANHLIEKSESKESY